jgi:hypothetical protein
MMPTLLSGKCITIFDIVVHGWSRLLLAKTRLPHSSKDRTKELEAVYLTLQTR